MNIIFICTANVSRSFLAEMLFRDEINRRCLKGVSVSSAGINAVPGYPPDAKMIEYLIDREIPVAAHVSRRIQQEDVDGANRIFVMEKRQADEIVRRWPRAADKVELLGSYVYPGAWEGDIPDPYGRSPYHYRLVQSQISLAIDNIVRNIQRL